MHDFHSFAESSTESRSENLYLSKLPSLDELPSSSELNTFAKLDYMELPSSAELTTPTELNSSAELTASTEPSVDPFTEPSAQELTKASADPHKTSRQFVPPASAVPLTIISPILALLLSYTPHTRLAFT